MEARCLRSPIRLTALFCRSVSCPASDASAFAIMVSCFWAKKKKEDIFYSDLRAPCLFQPFFAPQPGWGSVVLGSKNFGPAVLGWAAKITITRSRHFELCR